MKSIGIADLKAHLSKHLRTVRRGRTVTIVDRETPIAQIVPYRAETTGPELVVTRRRAGAPATGGVALPPPLELKGDIVALLLEERQGHR